MGHMNYSGRIELDTDMIFGPDMYGAFYRAKEAVYDAGKDATAIKFSPGTYAKLAADVIAERSDEQLEVFRRNLAAVGFWRNGGGNDEDRTTGQ